MTPYLLSQQKTPETGFVLRDPPGGKGLHKGRWESRACPRAPDPLSPSRNHARFEAQARYAGRKDPHPADRAAAEAAREKAFWGEAAAGAEPAAGGGGPGRRRCADEVRAAWNCNMRGRVEGTAWERYAREAEVEPGRREPESESEAGAAGSDSKPGGRGRPASASAGSAPARARDWGGGERARNIARGKHQLARKFTEAYRGLSYIVA